MKANAPEKIYIQPNAHDGWFETNNLTESLTEYIRKDTFIEKACDFISSLRRLDDDVIEDFKNYIEGE